MSMAPGAAAAGGPLRSAPPTRPPADQPQASPTMQSPSTVQASPLSTPHPASSTNGMHQPKSRARIACLNCRRSKIRCDADRNGAGYEIPCPHCKRTGKDCLFPPNDPTSSAGKRASVSGGHDSPSADRSEPRKRKRVAPSASSKDLSAADRDIYDPQLYSARVWGELYDIFRQHYATELPFLHETSFIDKLSQIDIQSMPEFDAPLVLAFLALTVPFHDAIVQQLAQDPRQISRRYADAAESKINSIQALARPSVEMPHAIKIPQALLMLGLRAHGDAQGNKSFITLGNAISCMQLLGCHYEAELDHKKRSIARKEPRDSRIGEDRFIEDEIKRRTFWSCFIIDRYISSGDYKPRRIHLRDTLVQLPCCDEQFDHGFKVRTRLLRETDEEFSERRKRYEEDHPEEKGVKWEDEDKQDPLVWFIKALDLYGDVMKYACTVTRRYDPTPPWEDPSPSKVKLNFYRLDKKVDELVSKLPANLELSPSRTNVHIHRRRSTPYVLLHLTLSMCKIALHREYFPFITDSKSEPEGPVDGPRWEELRAHPKADAFWKRSASTCFRATKDCFELLSICNQRGALVETPLTAFICYTVVFTIMWSAFYPNMDVDGFICKGKDYPDSQVVDNFEQGFALLCRLHTRMNLARTFCRRLKGELFTKLGEGRLTREAGSPTEREVQQSLKAYLDLEKDHKEFGAEEVPDSQTTEFEDLSPPNLRRLLRVSEHGTNPTDNLNSPSTIHSEIKSEDGAMLERHLAPGSHIARAPVGFTAVNSNSGNNNPHGSSMPTAAHIPSSQSPHSVHHIYSHPVYTTYPDPAIPVVASTVDGYTPIGRGILANDGNQTIHAQYTQTANGYTMTPDLGLYPPFLQGWNEEFNQDVQYFTGEVTLLGPSYHGQQLAQGYPYGNQGS